MPDIENANDTVQEVIEEIASETGLTVDQAVAQLDNFGLDVTEVTEEEAEQFKAARREGDPEKAVEVLRAHDVDEDFIDQIKEAFRGRNAPETASGSGEGGDDADESGAESVASASDTAVSQDEVQQMIRQEVPSADEIAAAMESRMGGGGGGQTQAAAAQGGGDDGMSPQAEMAMRIASQYLQPDNAGPMQQAQEKMMESMTEMMAKQAARPSLEYEIGRKVTEDLVDNLGIEVEGGDAVDIGGEGESNGDEQ